VGVVLVAVAIFLAAESRALLIGESAGDKLVEVARRTIEADDAATAIELLRTMHMGPDHVVMTASVRFAPGTADIAARIANLKTRLAEADALLTDVTIEPVASE
jgi:divalent metal cation (Fe/Co/Zn/Cd) transporter